MLYWGATDDAKKAEMYIHFTLYIDISIRSQIQVGSRRTEGKAMGTARTGKASEKLR